jgi:hypothetical protein
LNLTRVQMDDALEALDTSLGEAEKALGLS